MDIIRKSPAMQFGLIFLIVGFAGLIRNGGINVFFIIGLAFTAGAYIQWRNANP